MNHGYLKMITLRIDYEDFLYEDRYAVTLYFRYPLTKDDVEIYAYPDKINLVFKIGNQRTTRYIEMPKIIDVNSVKSSFRNNILDIEAKFKS